MSESRKRRRRVQTGALKEDVVKRLIKAYLDEIGAYYWMPPSGPFGKRAFPDFVGHWCGIFFTIEAKGYGGKITGGQVLTGTRIVDAGGVWLLIDHTNVHDIRNIFRRHGLGYWKGGKNAASVICGRLQEVAGGVC